MLRSSWRAMACMIALSPSVASAATETTLYSFKGSPDGAFSKAGLFQDSHGDLYGTTSAGGTGTGMSCFEGGCGIVFKLTHPAKAGGAWKETVLYSFNGGTDGSSPQAGVVQDSSGALYGTTRGGGVGWGTVFKLKPPVGAATAWTETILHTFKGGPGDGGGPSSGLLSDGKGGYYGLTAGGGTVNDGAVYWITPPATGKTWKVKLLRCFTGGTDGNSPNGELIVDGHGALYGTTFNGGDANSDGTVFRLTPPATGVGAWGEKVLYRFKGGTDGAGPQAGLTFDAAGNVYGTTFYSGTVAGGACSTQGCGTAFKLTKPPTDITPWPETVLYRFKGKGDGGHPQAGLTFGSKGVLYGPTSSGGDANGDGVIFSLTPPVSAGLAWTEKVVRGFTGGADGAHPGATLVAAPGGGFFGTTTGSFMGPSHGAAFKLVP